MLSISSGLQLISSTQAQVVPKTASANIACGDNEWLAEDEDLRTGFINLKTNKTIPTFDVDELGSSLWKWISSFEKHRHATNGQQCPGHVKPSITQDKHLNWPDVAHFETRRNSTLHVVGTNLGRLDFPFDTLDAGRNLSTILPGPTPK